MATSKAGVNSQSGNRLDELETSSGAGLIGADDSGGLTPASIQDQLNELKALIDASGGGVFKVIDMQSGQVGPSSTGTLLSKSIADVPGATHLKIKHLLCSSSSPEPNCRLVTDVGLDLTGDVADNTPAASASNNVFGVYTFDGGVNPSQAARIFKELFCENFTLTKVSGATSFTIDWVVEYGVVE